MQYVFATLMCVFAVAYAARKEDGLLSHRLFYKSAASVMFVLIAVAARADGQQVYYILILIGLCLALAADVLMVLTDFGNKYLVAGASLFALTHVLYIVAFTLRSRLNLYDIATFAVLIFIGTAVFGNKLKHLGKLKIPTIIYVILLCAMVTKAISMLFLDNVNMRYALLVAAGGGLFGISDLLLGMRSAYPARKKTYSILNTITYYAGQGLIALSVMM